MVLSADKRGYPPADIAPARRRDPNAFLTELLRRYPQEVAGTVDAMGAALREPLTRRQVPDRLAVSGVPKFAAQVATMG